MVQRVSGVTLLLGGVVTMAGGCGDDELATEQPPVCDAAKGGDALDTRGRRGERRARSARARDEDEEQEEEGRKEQAAHGASPFAIAVPPQTRENAGAESPEGVSQDRSGVSWDRRRAAEGTREATGAWRSRTT